MAYSAEKKKSPNHRGIQNHLILIGIVFSLLYWILQSLMRAYIFYDGTFYSQLLPRDADELWLRSLVVFILLMFTVFIQFLFIKIEKAEHELQKSRDEFIAILTHDLKTPLSGMMGYAELIENPRGGEICRDKLEYACIIRESGTVMLTMINNIVNTSKLESGQMEYDYEDFSLAELLGELYRTFDSLAQSGKVTLEFSCPESLFTRADRGKVRQIFYNLVSNALRYTKEGGRISIKAAPEKKQVAIEVGDDGKGIPYDAQGTIFEKYRQVKGERRGTGLGLYIVKQFLKGHGCEIRLKSAPGEGTRFFFSLPGSELNG